jgi:hypothetical protein
LTFVPSPLPLAPPEHNGLVKKKKKYIKRIPICLENQNPDYYDSVRSQGIIGVRPIIP